LKPEQTATLASSRQAGTLSLALRSIADVNQVTVSSNDSTQRPGINVVRYGVNNPGAAAAK
jgi:pilus assembly protein CpaB